MNNTKESELSQVECSICFEPLKNDAQVFKTECNHAFHYICVMPLKTCPLCRTPLDMRNATWGNGITLSVLVGMSKTSKEAFEILQTMPGTRTI